MRWRPNRIVYVILNVQMVGANITQMVLRYRPCSVSYFFTWPCLQIYSKVLSVHLLGCCCLPMASQFGGPPGWLASSPRAGQLQRLLFPHSSPKVLSGWERLQVINQGMGRRFQGVLQIAHLFASAVLHRWWECPPTLTPAPGTTQPAILLSQWVVSFFVCFLIYWSIVGFIMCLSLLCSSDLF